MEPFETRRRALLDRLDRAVAVFPSPPVARRNGDVEHAWRQDSDLYYLTGLDEPECALVLTRVHNDFRSVLFVRARKPEREAWEGPRVGVDEAPRRFGVNAAFPIEELANKLPDFLQNAQRLVTRLGRDPAHDALVLRALDTVRSRERTGVSWPTEIVDPLVLVHEMRLLKGSHELEAMRAAIRHTREGHLEVMKAARAGMNECELEAILTHTYRRRGSARHAFAPIVASGPNATVLHYERNTRTIEPGELVLVDSGCELDYCAADVTRTFPVDGRFDERQRRIYEIVLAAELAAIAEVKPEATLDDVHKKACEVIVDGLLGLGLLAGERDDIVEKGSFKRFYPHRTSHWLGMDVHDAGRYFVDGKPRPLGPGMVLTVEPGLYIPPSGDHAPPELRGIGVRIEDDVLVTEDGCEVLTASIPKAIDEIEACCPR